jgi:hypothetical protein
MHKPPGRLLPAQAEDAPGWDTARLKAIKEELPTGIPQPLCARPGKSSVFSVKIFALCSGPIMQIE